MLQVEAGAQKLMYLGSIDDKVVQYQNIQNPERQLLRALFFSAILGDPLVLNDGYLLHSKWGRRQLIDPGSPVRQLNSQQHLLQAARSSKRYSEWIPEQAEKTRSYRDLLEGLQPGELNELDQAWTSCASRQWPALNLQTTMLNMLRSSAGSVLREEVSGEILDAHGRLFERRIADGETVRAGWESAMLELGDKLRAQDRAVMMEFANEAYHASFACGFAGGTEGVEVGIAGFGRRRLHGRGAYQQEAGEGLSALLQSSEFERSQASLSELATVYVTNREGDLFGGTKLADFLSSAGTAKRAYRESLQALLRSEQPTSEQVEALEHALQAYGGLLHAAFGVREHRAILRLIDLVHTGEEQMGRRGEAVDLAVKLLGVVGAHLPGPAVEVTLMVGDLWGFGQPLIQSGLPAVTNVYLSLQRRRTQAVPLLPLEVKSGYELSLDAGFVREATEGVAAFAS